MKKAVLVMALMVGMISLSKAQGGGGGQGRQRMPPADRAKAFFENQQYTAFAFTADQKAKMTPMLVKFYTSSDSLRATMTQGGDRTAMQAKTAALGAPYEAAFVAMLTPDQKKAYDTALAAAKERQPNATAVFTRGFGGGRGNRPGGGGGAPATPPNN